MAGQRVGYIRVSSIDQNPDRQLDEVGVDRVFVDKASGKDVHRPQLDQLLAFVRDGDTLVVHSMDRLARNLDDLRKLVQTLTRRGVRIEFVKEHLTCIFRKIVNSDFGKSLPGISVMRDHSFRK